MVGLGVWGSSHHHGDGRKQHRAQRRRPACEWPSDGDTADSTSGPFIYSTATKDWCANTQHRNAMLPTTFQYHETGLGILCTKTPPKEGPPCGEFVVSVCQ